MDAFKRYLLFLHILSVQIRSKGRSWEVSTATAEQLRETVAAGTACYGRHTVDTTAHTVRHVVERSPDPSFDGAKLTRSSRLQGNDLVLSGTFSDGGEKYQFEITWSRLR